MAAPAAQENPRPKSNQNQNQVRIILWTFPRTISTAFTKCLSHIEGIEVWFEPYGYCSLAARHYKILHGEELPTAYRGNEDKFAEAARLVSLDVNAPPGVIRPERLAYDTIKTSLEQSTSKYVLVKEMAFSMSDEKYRQFIPSGFSHAFLIRHPTPSIRSFRKALYHSLTSAGKLTRDSCDESDFDLVWDCCVLQPGLFHEDLCKLWKYTSDQQSTATTPRPGDPENTEYTKTRASSAVIESDDLLSKPHEVLPKFCRMMSLPYNCSLLEWDASPDVTLKWRGAGDEIMRYHQHFYAAATKSSRFDPPTKDREIDATTLTDDVKRILERAIPYYNEMFAHKI